MATNVQSLSQTARIALLARIAHSLTIVARHTYEVGTDNVLEPQVLRSYNELLHRVTGAVVSHGVVEFARFAANAWLAALLDGSLDGNDRGCIRQPESPAF